MTSSPPRRSSTSRSASSASSRHSITSRGTLPFSASDLVARADARPLGRRAGRDSDNQRGRHEGSRLPGRRPGVPGQSSVASGQWTSPARARSTRCSWRRLAASVPAWRWRSRRWRGWCGPSSRPSTATTRSSTTRWWSIASRRWA